MVAAVSGNVRKTFQGTAGIPGEIQTELVPYTIIKRYHYRNMTYNSHKRVYVCAYVNIDGLVEEKCIEMMGSVEIFKPAH